MGTNMRTAGNLLLNISYIVIGTGQSLLTYCCRTTHRIGVFLSSLNLTTKDSVVVCGFDSVCVVISLVKTCCFNIVGDKLLLRFGVKLQNCHGNASYVSEPNWFQSFKML